jgi:Flp pilus assembly protein TadG
VRRSGRELSLQPRKPSGARGAAGVLVIAFLPVLLAALAALAGLGHAAFWRQRAFQAADLAALAAVQCLDLTELAAGRIALLPDEAASAAVSYAHANIGEMSPQPEITVTVLNAAADGHGLTDPVTGRLHEHATVCVLLEISVRFRFGPVAWVQVIRAHADAAIIPR